MGRPRIHPPKDPNRPKQLHKINSGSFSKTNQPRPPAPPRPPRRPTAGRPKGVQNKMTLVKKTLDELGYNPASMQVALAGMLMDMAGKAHVGSDTKTLIQCSRELIKVNSELMSYVSAKAKHGDEEPEEYNIEHEDDEVPTITQSVVREITELDEDGVIIPKGSETVNKDPVPLSPTELLEARKRMTSR